MTDRFRALFFGSPAFAVPSLDALARHRRRGRRRLPAGQARGARPRADAARGEGARDRARAAGRAADEAADGRVRRVGARRSAPTWRSSSRTAASCRRTCSRGRASGASTCTRRCLPKYRGAAPITWAVVHGEAESGVTLMKLDEGMDTGPTFARVVTPVGPDETAGELSERLARLGADAVREWLPRYVAGVDVLAPQDDARATMAPMLEKEHGRIDWTQSAAAGARPRARDEPVAGRVHDGARQDAEGARHARGGRRPRPARSPGRCSSPTSRACSSRAARRCVELASVQPRASAR